MSNFIESFSLVVDVLAKLSYVHNCVLLMRYALTELPIYAR